MPATKSRNTTRIEIQDELTVRGRVLALLSSLAVFSAWLTGEDQSRLAAAVLLAALLVDWLAKLRKPRIEVRAAPRQVEAGIEFLETWRVQNGSRALAEVRLTEPRAQTATGTALVTHLAARQALLVTMPARLRSRGVFAERLLWLDVLQPFGFVRRRYVLHAPAMLIVEPARVDLPGEVLAAPVQRAEEQSITITRGEDEFYSLRELGRLEDVRHVHAARSASTGTLLRRVFCSDDAHHAWLVLDLRRPPGRSPRTGGRRYEWSISAAARLCDELRDRQMSFTCLVLGPETRVLPVESEPQARDFLAMLAGVNPQTHCPVDLSSWPELAAAPLCYWIPAGGALASGERAMLPKAILVSETPPP